MRAPDKVSFREFQSDTEGQQSLSGDFQNPLANVYSVVIRIFHTHLHSFAEEETSVDDESRPARTHSQAFMLRICTRFPAMIVEFRINLRILHLTRHPRCLVDA
jgi:hypothetical protein